MSVRYWVLGVAAAAVAIAAAAENPAPYSTRRGITAEDHLLAQLVTAEWPAIEFSSSLSRGAQAISEVCSDGRMPTSANVRKALHEAGLPEGVAVTSTIATTEDGPYDALDSIEAVLQGADQVTHIGLGRSQASRPPFRWQWTILLIDRRIELIDDLPSVHQPEAAFPIRFSVRADWRRPRILVQYPDGSTRRMRPARRDDQWFTVVPVGPDDGEIVVQILAENEVGPGVIAVMPMRVGNADFRHPRDVANQESHAYSTISDPIDAALQLWTIVNAERIDHGLSPLNWDSDLASIASRHSQDMLGSGFFGHRSPTQGDLQQRLTEAAYFAAVSRENLAMDQDLESAHQSLMASPGHRANILASDVTDIGIGVVKQLPEEGPPLWLITEIFTKPFASSVPTDQP